MTSKERVRAVMRRERPDRIPAAFEAVGSVSCKLIEHYGLNCYHDLIEKFDIDIVSAHPRYIGPDLPTFVDEAGRTIHTSFWGYQYMLHRTAVDEYETTTYFPLNDVETIEDVDACAFPSADWFDYTPITEICDKYPEKAIIVGHEGPFQMVTFLIEMDRFFMLMIDAPEVAMRILERMNEFEMEYYRRIFEAGGGRVDVLRPHDDYGTQISLLFSTDMWREFYRENTRRLVALAHSYSCDRLSTGYKHSLFGYDFVKIMAYLTIAKGSI